MRRAILALLLIVATTAAPAVARPAKHPAARGRAAHATHAPAKGKAKAKAKAKAKPTVTKATKHRAAAAKPGPRTRSRASAKSASHASRARRSPKTRSKHETSRQAKTASRRAAKGKAHTTRLAARDETANLAERSTPAPQPAEPALAPAPEPQAAPQPPLHPALAASPAALARIPARPLWATIARWRLPPLAPMALPSLANALPVMVDEKRLERVIRIDGFRPVDALVDGLAGAPVDGALLADRFATLDRDGDGRLTLDEWTGSRPLFRRLDRNGDGVLERGELSAADPRLREACLVDRERYVAFELLDVDDDGVLAPWEWAGDMDVFFRLDLDGDGAVSRQEYLGLVRGAAPVSARLLWNGTLDANGDGVVDTVEWVGDPYRFARFDLDHDGRIERWEAFAGWLLRA